MKINTVKNILKGTQLTANQMKTAFNKKSKEYYYDPKLHTYTENRSGKVFDGNTGLFLLKKLKP